MLPCPGPAGTLRKPVRFKAGGGRRRGGLVIRIGLPCHGGLAAMSLPPDNSARLSEGQPCRPAIPCRRASRRSQARGGGVHKAGRGYSLRSERAGVPIARLKPTRNADTVQVLWWNGQHWGAPGPFGIATMPLDAALDHVASEPHFWINAKPEMARVRLRTQSSFPRPFPGSR